MASLLISSVSIVWAATWKAQACRPVRVRGGDPGVVVLRPEQLVPGPPQASPGNGPVERAPWTPSFRPSGRDSRRNGPAAPRSAAFSRPRAASVRISSRLKRHCFCGFSATCRMYSRQVVTGCGAGDLRPRRPSQILKTIPRRMRDAVSGALAAELRRPGDRFGLPTCSKSSQA